MLHAAQKSDVGELSQICQVGVVKTSSMELSGVALHPYATQRHSNRFIWENAGQLFMANGFRALYS